MLALGSYRRRICACGFHESVANDPANHFTFDVDTCPVCRGAARFARMQHAAQQQQRKALGEKRPPEAPDPADGVTVLTRLMTPAEAAEARVRAQHTAPAQSAPGPRATRKR